MNLYQETRNEYNINQQYKSKKNFFENDPDPLTNIYIWLVLFSCLLLIYIIRYFKYNHYMIENNNNIPTNLNDRMKFYEINSQKIDFIHNDCPFLIRLNGRAFGNYSKKLMKIGGESKDPFSKKIYACMYKTAEKLQKEFKCATVFTHSDEIILIFNKANDSSEHIFKGCLSKLISLTASCASSAFIYNLKNFYGDKLEFIDPVMFDARIIVFPQDKQYELVNYMIWYSKYECTRNFISMVSENILGKKKLHGLSNGTRLKMLNDMGYDFNSDTSIYPLKYGAFIKYNNVTKSHICWVFKNITFYFDFYKFLTENHDYLFSQEMENILEVYKYELNNEGNLVNISTPFSIYNETA